MMKNDNENEKKGLFSRLSGGKKTKKDSCCCSFELEEVTEENPDNDKDQKDGENTCRQ